VIALVTAALAGIPLDGAVDLGAGAGLPGWRGGGGVEIEAAGRAGDTIELRLQQAAWLRAGSALGPFPMFQTGLQLAWTVVHHDGLWTGPGGYLDGVFVSSLEPQCADAGCSTPTDDPIRFALGHGFGFGIGWMLTRGGYRSDAARWEAFLGIGPVATGGDVVAYVPRLRVGYRFRSGWKPELDAGGPGVAVLLTYDVSASTPRPVHRQTGNRG
jgi:hypothetical protein